MTPRLGIGVTLGLLLLVIAAEWLLPAAGNFTASGENDYALGSKLEAGPLAALGPDALVARIMDRPLFLPGRHLPVVQTQAPPAVVEKQDPVPRLMGVMITSDGATAIFQIAGTTKPVVTGVGGKVSDWTVSAITQTGVTITGEQGAQTLSPTPDPNDSSGAGYSGPSGGDDPPSQDDQ